MMLQAFGAGCTALVEVGDDRSNGGGGGPDGVESGESSASSGGAGSGDFSSTTGGSPEPAAAGAIAIFGRQLPEEPSAYWEGGVLDPNPDDLFIFIGAPVRSCVNPAYFIGCDTWHVDILIPPALQVPGVIDLDAPGVVPFVVANGPHHVGGISCAPSFSGSAFTGTLEIVSIDDEQVVVRLSDSDTEYFDANGEYTAVRCP
ncbi:hypothetical protein WMF30_39975 [Sorangium sp. So ce134]